ncbi:peptidoglycan-associated lipoprotein Pal [Beggiatoa leptomitoformis]|uniref:Peptidoglycan-associated lipoprotein n=1 Tax=Beggiatoa leptomitoformis TaxID=288004 RepID=A0A2N9YIQ7_9GAMM|nr:peptidoglycan-associated lipoprotein Pal [Beggiatoa leptomitoformis]ALG67402.1 peptidoglycan-associated lipoprotein Pal [Beggiatoa leptomitoformis]AUI70387.1 peptidoglycan-associated lipoprotein Pal [Beggiatoa leptomitoformis]
MKKYLRYLAVLMAVLAFAGCSSKGGEKPAEMKPEETVTPPPVRDPMTTGVEQGSVDGNNMSGVAAPADRIVFFDYDRSDIRPEGRNLLEEHARFLSANPTMTIRLEGHADERGSREYNLALGERRAESVKRMMTILGISADRLTTLSYGEERPLDLGNGESSWQRNRRVELVYP